MWQLLYVFFASASVVELLHLLFRQRTIFSAALEGARPFASWLLSNETLRWRSGPPLDCIVDVFDGIASLPSLFRLTSSPT